MYYLSAEFLMGRSLLNAVYNLGVKDQYAEAIKELGYDLETAVSNERDASLGNGGLGRLAACFLDSMATLSLPGWGYGIRYRYGMFKQALDSELKQQELPDVWLTNGTHLCNNMFYKHLHNITCDACAQAVDEIPLLCCVWWPELCFVIIMLRGA